MHKWAKVGLESDPDFLSLTMLKELAARVLRCIHLAVLSGLLMQA